MLKSKNSRLVDIVLSPKERQIAKQILGIGDIKTASEIIGRRFCIRPEVIAKWYKEINEN